MTGFDIPYLRTHSYYGFQESLMSPFTLVSKAHELGIKTLGLTDHKLLSGAIEFYEACRQVGIKPLIGLEVDLLFQDSLGRLVFFAKDSRGWSNLSKLSSKLLISDKPLDIDTISTHQEGLLCLAGGHQSILQALLDNPSHDNNFAINLLGDLKAIFDEDCFVEVQRYFNKRLNREQALRELARHHQIPLVASQNIHYCHPQDQQLLVTLTAIRQNLEINHLADRHHPPGPVHFPTQEDFFHRFRDLPESLENLIQIVERCWLELPIGETHYPTFPTPQGVSQSEYLRNCAFEGAKNLYPELTQEIRNRLEYELNIITQLGYEPIFLIMADVLKHARKLGIPTSSRGSAASSLVAHCLRITSPDPLALDLYFERFLNPARNKPPDIDTDIASHRREEVIQYVFDTYGRDKVAMVSTINRYRPKSAFTDVAKAYGLPPEMIRQLSKKLASSYYSRSSTNTKNPFEPLELVSNIPNLNQIVQDARSILDMPRHLSVHPGGIIIAPFPMTNLIPLIYSPSLNINHTQFDLEGVEKFGMVKIDLLGIRGLTVLGEVADQIQAWHQKDFRSGLHVLQEVPSDDPRTAQTIAAAQTIGCFQIESPGMRATLREINAQTPEDIMAALALYRPGPLRGGLRDAFVSRFRGDEKVNHIHPSLETLLGDTLGVILYQEQVLRIAHELGGLSIAQADLLRRAMSHFNPGDVMSSLKKDFTAGATQRHSIPIDVAERIWEMMAAFAGYGFPKAHAASYAQLAWNSAWCKTHYPAEFMCAVLGYSGGYYSQRVYLMEARRLGLVIKPPHVNHARQHFRTAYPHGEAILYMGLNQVRDLTQKTLMSIIRHQPYKSLDDFISRVNPHKKEARHLIMCGAFEGLISIPDGLMLVNQTRIHGQMTLFTESHSLDEWTREQISFAQQEILGVSLSISPLERFSAQIESSGAVSTLEAVNYVGQQITVAGMRQVFRRFRNLSNEWMGQLTLEDNDGSLAILVPPTLYRRHHPHLNQKGPFIIRGLVEEDSSRNRITIIASAIQVLE